MHTQLNMSSQSWPAGSMSIFPKPLCPSHDAVHVTAPRLKPLKMKRVSMDGRRWGGGENIKLTISKKVIEQSTNALKCVAIKITHSPVTGPWCELWLVTDLSSQKLELLISSLKEQGLFAPCLPPPYGGLCQGWPWRDTIDPDLETVNVCACMDQLCVISVSTVSIHYWYKEEMRRGGKCACLHESICTCTCRKIHVCLKGMGARGITC